MRGGQNPFGQDIVFMHNRYTVQGSPVRTRFDLAFSCLSSLQRIIRTDGNIRP